MDDKTLATTALGLHREGSILQGVLLESVRGKPKCLRSFDFDGISYEGAVNPLLTSQRGKELIKLASKKLVVSGIESYQTIVRNIDVQLKRESDIAEVLPFQIEPLLPFPLEEGFIDKTYLDETTNGFRLTVQAVRAEELEQHIDGMLELSLEPEVVGSVPQALAALLSLQKEPKQSQVCLHIGALYTTLVLVDTGRLVSALPLKTGWTHLIEAHRSDLKQNNKNIYQATELSDIDFINLNSLKSPSLYALFVRFRKELMRLFLSLLKQDSQQTKNGLFITGELALHPTLPSALSNLLNRDLEWLEDNLIDGLNSLSIHRLAIPSGLALTALPNKAAQINFRQGRLAYPRPWRRMRSTLATTLILCLLTAAALWIYGNALITSKEDSLTSSYLYLLQAAQKDYNEMERKEKESENGSKEVDSSLHISAEQIEERLTALEKELAQTPVSIALVPNTPRVSDLLAWLGNHPLIAPEEENEGKDNAIHIDSLNYKMVKRPDFNKAKEHYQVQVDMEISSNSAKAARLFYDSLVLPNELVDTRSEVKWTAGSGKYRLSFYLKDKTIYP